jgi:DNA-binding NtrC family response regulator
MKKDTILIVDDEPNVVTAIKRIFIHDPYEIFSGGSASEGMEILRSHPVKVVISDERMPGVTGSEFLSTVREQFPNTIRIMLTGHASINTAMKAVNEGEIYRFLTKPWDDVELRLTVQTALDKYNLEEENRRLLKIVMQQAINLKLLERQFPGITKLDHGEDGRIMLPDISEEELSQIIAQCERDYI